VVGAVAAVRDRALQQARLGERVLQALLQRVEARVHATWSAPRA